jgi:hypothetical protein
MALAAAWAGPYTTITFKTILNGEPEAMVEAALSASSGPETHANSHQQIQGIYNYLIGINYI